MRQRGQSERRNCQRKCFVGLRHEKKFCQIVTSFVTVLLNRHYVYVFTLYLQKTH